MSTLLLFNLKTDAEDDVLGFTTDWIRSLSTRFKQVFVLTMQAGRYDLPDNVQVYSVGKEKGYGELRRGLEFYRRLIWILSRHKVDVCFAHMMPLFAVMAWPLLRLRRKPILLWYAHKSVTPLLRLSEKLVDGVVSSTKTGFQIESAKLRLIGQGVDVERFAPAPDRQGREDGFVVLTLGRISRIKRLEILLAAAAGLRASGLDIRVVLAGGTCGADDEAYLEELRTRSAGSGLAGAVHFTGGIPFGKVQTLYREADAFVNTSDTESLDKAILEAMSCGIPVVSSNLALKDILPGDLAGRSVVARGDLESLTARLRQLHDMGKEARKALGLRLREIVVADHSLNGLSERVGMELARLQSHGRKSPRLGEAA